MFGASPKIEIRGKRKIKSCCGALVSLLAILIIVFYLAYKLLYFMQDIPLVSLVIDMVMAVSGIELNEALTFKL